MYNAPNNTSNNVVQTIKDTIDIVQVASKYVQLKPKGNKYWGLSPFKSEKTPSFTVDPEKNLYYCFSTSQGGDAFNLIMKLENVDFMGAVRILAQELGISLDNYSKNTPQASEEDIKTLELCTRITGTFMHFLWDDEGKIAREYINERKFSEEIIKKFKLGYTPDDQYWLYNFLNSKGYSQSQIQDSGLFSKNYEKYPLFKGRIVFPIATPSGQVVAFGGRLLQGEGPKYLNSPETKFYKKKELLYGLYQCLQADGFKALKKAYLVEGYFDVIAMHEAGIISAVAPLGTAFTIEQARIIRRHTDSIVLVFDNDEAGENATVKSAINCELVGFKSISLVELQDKDPAEILKIFSKAELCEQLIDEKDFFEYYVLKLFPGLDANVQEYELALQKLVLYLQSVQSKYKQAKYSSKVAELFQIPQKTIFESIERKQHIQLDDKNDNSVINTEVIISKNNETMVIAALCALIDDNTVYEQFRQQVKLSDLKDESARYILSVIEDEYRKGELSFHNLLNILDTHHKNFIELLILSGEVSDNADSIIHEYLSQLKITRLLKRSQKIDSQLRVYCNSNAPSVVREENEHEVVPSLNKGKNLKEQDRRTVINDLLAEKKFINNEIIKLKNSSV